MSGRGWLAMRRPRGSSSVASGYTRAMETRATVEDRHGRTWAVRVGSQEEAEAEDRSWYERMTPEERVLAVEDCTLSALKAQGIDELPRVRRVCRVVERG
jgi:hypothetical protein